MVLSNWINLGLLIVSVFAAAVALASVVVARNMQKEANETQKHLLDVEGKRDTVFERIELTPNLSATRIVLRENGSTLFVEAAVTNLSRHAIHIIAIAAYNVAANDILALGRQNKLVRSAEQIDVYLGTSPVPVHTKIETDVGHHFTTSVAKGKWQLGVVLNEASEVGIYFQLCAYG